jgi:sugar phosphate isomerase/epimerase
MKLSLTAWSFPACSLEECAGISKALGIHALDVGLFYRSALDRQQLLTAPEQAAQRIKALDIAVPNYYHLFGDSLSARNLADPDSLADNLRDMAQVLHFADAAAIPTVFILPGVVNPGQSREAAFSVSATALTQLLRLAEGYKAEICIEPHVQSWAESPTLVLELIQATGIKLALDYSHFACLGYRQEEVDPLAPHALHVHLRQAKMGALQSKFAQGTLNFPALFGTLRDAGYRSALAIEPVHQDYMNTLFDDVLTEVVALRDCFTTWMEAD